MPTLFMKPNKHLTYLSFAFPAFISITSTALAAEQSLNAQWLVPDKVLYKDDFSKHSEIAETGKKSDLPWMANQNTRWEVVDGVLRGRPSSDEFQASHKHHKGEHPRIALNATPEEYILQFSMRIVDGIPFDIKDKKTISPLLDIGHHICVFRWDTNGATLLCDGETTQLAVDKDFELIPGKWETVMIERRGTGVLLRFAGGPTFYGDHPSYVNDPHAVMICGLKSGVMEIDNVILTSIKKGIQPKWPAFLKTLPPQQNIVLREKRPGFLLQEAARKAKEAKKNREQKDDK
jgi:hypothetical protein